MNNIITNLSLNEFENDLDNFNIINEFESEERFTVFFKGLKKVFLFIIDILIKLIAYVTKNLYILLSNQIDNFNMMSKFIKPKYLKDPTKTLADFNGKNIIDIESYRNSLLDLYRTYESSFNKINSFQTIEQVNYFNDYDKKEIKRQREIIDLNKKNFENSNLQRKLSESDFSNNLYTLKETRKELAEVRISLVLDKRNMNKQVKEIEKMDFSDTNEFLKSKKNLLSIISTDLTNLSKERIQILTFKIGYLKDQNFLIGQLYTTK